MIGYVFSHEKMVNAIQLSLQAQFKIFSQTFVKTEWCTRLACKKRFVV